MSGIDKVVVGDATLYTGSCLDVLPLLPADSVHCVVSSPPYWGLRDYGTATWEGGSAECGHQVGRFTRSGLEGSKQITNSGSSAHEHISDGGVCPKCGAIRHDPGIGLEPTFAMWLDNMVAVMREVKRVLRPDGVCWINIGDCYVGSNNKAIGDMAYKYAARGTDENVKKEIPGLAAKQLMMMPARLALARQAAGWVLRSEIVGAKPNPMPESVTDRPTSAHEKIYLLTKRAHYFYDADAVREEHVTDAPNKLRDKSKEAYNESYPGGHFSEGARPEGNPAGRNLRNVWNIPTQAFPESHFATFPEELVRRCIAAGTSEHGVCGKCGKQWERVSEIPYDDEHPTYSNWLKLQECNTKYAGHKEQDSRGHGSEVSRYYKEVWNSKGSPKQTLGWRPGCECNAGEPVGATVLDPFSGAATTGLVALKMGRRYIGIELNPAYNKIALDRIQAEANQQKLW